MPLKLPYRRVLLKLSGEALKGNDNNPLLLPVIDRICQEIKELHSLGLEIAIVNGGGNIIRGANSEKEGINRITADYMGMLATIINGLAFQDRLENLGIKTKLFSALGIEEIADRFVRRNVIYELEKGRVVLFTAGTGNPFFSTDTNASLRAVEINADILLKATNVDGLYDDDPKINPNAVLYDEVSFTEVIHKNLKAMDMTAITLCQENNLPVKIFNINKKGNIIRAVSENIGTIIS
jgi:uridylate kinase